MSIGTLLTQLITFFMMIVPDKCKEPANVPHLNLPGVSGTQVVLPGASGTQVVLPGTSPVVRNMEPLVPPTRTHQGKGGRGGRGGKGSGKGGDKGSKSSNPTPTESGPDTVPTAESTATDKPDILDLTTEEREVEAAGESTDIGEKASLDID